MNVQIPTFCGLKKMVTYAYSPREIFIPIRNDFQRFPLNNSNFPTTFKFIGKQFYSIFCLPETLSVCTGGWEDEGDGAEDW